MFALGPIGFATPALLLALAALPVLWWLLRAVPPAPVRRAFPAVTLLLGLSDREQESARTPWWLLMLRLAALAAMIIGFAGPVLNPVPKSPGDAPLLVLIDDGWAAAPDWAARLAAASRALRAAEAGGRRAAVVTGSAPPAAGTLPLRTAGDAARTLAALNPRPWRADLDGLRKWADRLEGPLETVWISDGLQSKGRGELARTLQALGPLSVLEPPAARLGLRPAEITNGTLRLTALRSRTGATRQITVTGIGPDPAGIERDLARATLTFDAAADTATAEIELPPEIRNRIARFAIDGQNAAGAVTLADDSLRRRKVALVGAGAGREGLDLLSPLHYLRQALAPTAEVIEGPLEELLAAAPDVIVLADVATLPPAQAEKVKKWVEDGGLLLRFAGPRLAAADARPVGGDPLLPVRLRAGGRTVGGAMSWGTPQRLAPFAENSPFYGLTIPADVTVRSQVLAEPGPELAGRTIAALEDGTPLVTRKALGNGEVVLFHTAANAEWSSLPISGLFVEMLERLAVLTRGATPDRAALEGTIWVPVQLLDGFGRLEGAEDRSGVPGSAMTRPVGRDLPPGLYAAEARRIAVNVLGPEARLAPARWPAGVTPHWQAQSPERKLSGWFLAAALALVLADIVATLALSGRIGGGLRTAGAALVAMLIAASPPGPARAQTPPPGEIDPKTLAAALEVTLAYVETGDPEVDAISRAGLKGLSTQIRLRSSVEPATPAGLDLDRDELAVYPLIYWPVTTGQPTPSDAAYARLNAYLRNGGLILFDTRDGDVSGYGTGATAEAARLRRLARPLDIPPLEPVPPDHVLTRTFYLLTDFPGRFAGTPVWVEAAPADAKRAEGMPFRNLNDGVTPVVIGGNDWAGAWAVDDAGLPMLPVGRGRAGERQREMAYRFGLNLVMHVLTGNYKSDQVHVPALLERLGQ